MWWKSSLLKATVTNIVIESADQPLPVTMTMESFWASSGSKEQLQMFFINWLCKTYNYDKPVYLGESVPGDLNDCIGIRSRFSSSYRALKCDHEEPEERILFHVNYVTQIVSYKKLILAVKVLICLQNCCIIVSN